LENRHDPDGEVTMHRGNRVLPLFLREIAYTVCVVASSAMPVSAELQIPTSFASARTAK